MGRLIPQVIEELEYIDGLSSKYDPLVAYYKEFGSLGNIRTVDVYEYKGKSIEIGHLIALLRLQYKKGLLKEESITLLNEMGMVWSYDRLAPIKAYYNEFGSIANVRTKDTYMYQGKEFKIGVLVASLRSEYNKGELSAEDSAELETMGMVWNVNFNDKLEPFRAYYKEVGSLANIKFRDIYKYQGRDVRIGHLIRNLRQDYNNGVLSNEQITELESMGMAWEYDKLYHIRAYYKEFGTLADIKRSDVYKYLDKEIKIGDVVNSLRCEYNKGKLLENEITELESMGMIWKIRFDDKLEPLVAYYDEFGTIANIKISDVYIYEGKEVNIGLIISNLRKPNRRSKLTKEEVALLNSMGMVWHMQLEDRLAPLKAYYKEFGTIENIKTIDIYNYQGKEIRIGRLIRALRNEYKMGKLSDAEIKELESIGMVWVVLDTDDRLAPLKAYYNEFGTIENIKISDIYNYNGKEVRIGTLINHLRNEYNTGKLLDEQISELEAIGMVWELRARFKDRLAPLKAYYNEVGSLGDIKVKDIYQFQGKDIRIGSLINCLRTEYKQGKLSQEEIEVLNSMGMIWDATFRKNGKILQKKSTDNTFNNNDNLNV